MPAYTHIARPYAKAVFELASESQTIAPWSNFFEVLGELVNVDDMQRPLHSPVVEQSGVAQAMILILDSVITDQMQSNLLKLLASKRKLLIIPDLIKLFADLRIASEQAISATLTTAFEAPTEITDTIRDSLEQKLGCKVLLESYVDPKIIGGAIIQAGDFVVDGSIRDKLRRMATQLITS